MGILPRECNLLQCASFRCAFGAWPRNSENLRLVAGRGKETHEIGRRDPGRARVDERMEIQFAERDERTIEHNRDQAVAVVDGGERGNGAGLHAERRPQGLGLAERKPPRRADPAMQPFQVDLRIFLRGDEKQTVLTIDEKEILGVRARNLAAQAARLAL